MRTESAGERAQDTRGRSRRARRWQDTSIGQKSMVIYKRAEKLILILFINIVIILATIQ